MSQGRGGGDGLVEIRKYFEVQYESNFLGSVRKVAKFVSDNIWPNLNFELPCVGEEGLVSADIILSLSGRDPEPASKPELLRTGFGSAANLNLVRAPATIKIL